MSENTGGSILGKLKGKRDAQGGAADASAAPLEVVNDATGYGVQVQPANVAPGACSHGSPRVGQAGREC